jgi:hypothetical protein
MDGAQRHLGGAAVFAVAVFGFEFLLFFAFVSRENHGRLEAVQTIRWMFLPFSRPERASIFLDQIRTSKSARLIRHEASTRMDGEHGLWSANFGFAPLVATVTVMPPETPAGWLR